MPRRNAFRSTTTILQCLLPTPARLAVLAALLIGPPAAAAGLPAGIVIAVTGQVEPPTPSMTEIPADQPLHLGATSTLTFLHYAPCRLVTVSGGTLTVGLRQFHTDGRIESDKEGPCPRIYVPKEAAPAGRTTGGLLLRGIDELPRWPVNPEFLLAGSLADKVASAAIYDEDAPNAALLRLDVRERRAAVPGNLLPLLPNRRYVLQLAMQDRSAPIKITFIGTLPGASGSLVILRLD